MSDVPGLPSVMLLLAESLEVRYSHAVLQGSNCPCLIDRIFGLVGEDKLWSESETCFGIGIVLLPLLLVTKVRILAQQSPSQQSQPSIVLPNYRMHIPLPPTNF